MNFSLFQVCQQNRYNAVELLLRACQADLLFLHVFQSCTLGSFFNSMNKIALV
jgi:hypothetical protein